MVLAIEKDVIVLDNGECVDKSKFLDWVAWNGYNEYCNVRPGGDGEPMEDSGAIPKDEWIDSVSTKEFYAVLGQYLTVRHPNGDLKDLPDIGGTIINIANHWLL